LGYLSTDLEAEILEKAPEEQGAKRKEEEDIKKILYE